MQGLLHLPGAEVGLKSLRVSSCDLTTLSPLLPLLRDPRLPHLDTLDVGDNWAVRDLGAAPLLQSLVSSRVKCLRLAAIGLTSSSIESLRRVIESHEVSDHILSGSLDDKVFDL